MIALARLALLVLLPTSLAGQANEEEASIRKLPDPRDPASVGFQYDPQELHPAAGDDLPEWKRLLGPVGVGGFHVFPGRVTGPNTGPPRLIWGQGFGASLWRDPITGWPLQ